MGILCCDGWGLLPLPRNAIFFTSYPPRVETLYTHPQAESGERGEREWKNKGKMKVRESYWRKMTATSYITPYSPISFFTHFPARSMRYGVRPDCPRKLEIIGSMDTENHLMVVWFFSP